MAIDSPASRRENRKTMRQFFIFLLAAFLAVQSPAGAIQKKKSQHREPAVKNAFLVSLKNRNTLIGVLRTHVIRNDESLIELAPEYDVGYNEITDANPGVDPWLPGNGTVVKIPTLKILPDAPYRGIVVNVAEMRLYYYTKRKGHTVVFTYPIGIGMEGFNTPPGIYRIVQKIKDPAWYIPDDIRKQDPQLPPYIPPGRNNPMGRFALRLSRPTYLIHGTNKPFCVGRMASHGCMRLYNRDIKQLFAMVPVNTPVRIIYQPVKVGVRNGGIYVEAHRDYLHRGGDPYDVIARWLLLKGNYQSIDAKKLRKALKKRTGIPVNVTDNPRR